MHIHHTHMHMHVHTHICTCTNSGRRRSRCAGRTACSSTVFSHALATSANRPKRSLSSTAALLLERTVLIPAHAYTVYYLATTHSAILQARTHSRRHVRVCESTAFRPPVHFLGLLMPTHKKKTNTTQDFCSLSPAYATRWVPSTSLKSLLFDSARNFPEV